MVDIAGYFSRAWEVLMGPAPIDWCEENYQFKSFNIAEIHNTWTNIFYVIFGCIAYQRAENLYLSKIFRFFSVSLIMTGIFSGIFHATLIWCSQKLDETFETFTLLGLFYCLCELEQKNKFIVIHSIGCFLGIFFIPELFCEIHLFILAVSTYVIYLKKLT